jgi:MFS family permease
MSSTAEAANHPLAWRMAGIAFLAQNCSIGFMFGSFGLLLGAVESKMAVSRDVSSLGVPLVMLGMALMAPVVGGLSAKISVRAMMIAGALLNAAGYALLAFAPTITLNLVAYGLLIGPGICMVGTITPATLVTRWFTVQRGRALGIVHMPLAVAIVPLIAAFVLREYGLATVYLALAAGMALLVLPLLFVIDFPPSVADPSGEDMATEAAIDPGLSAGELLKRGRFWALALASASIGTGGTMIVTHLAPMVTGWGEDATQAATLMAIMPAAGIAGSVIFGWLADKLGGGWALTINCLNQAALWALLLLQPPFWLLLPLIALIGIHSSAISATFGMALSEQFGAASFGRGFGLSNLINLPFLVAGVPIGAYFFVHTGSYAGALITQIIFFGIGAFCAATMRRRPSAPALRTA